MTALDWLNLRAANGLQIPFIGGYWQVEVDPADQEKTALYRPIHGYSEKGLKLQPQKCQLLKREVKYLGHMIGPKGVAMDLDKMAAVRKWPQPETVRQVRAFLVFAGYYRRFIPTFASIAAPLHQIY
ncbi:hypothetical protein AAFF_G00135560 [Aldrovandia affinis]|uniref:Reverse transcriptase n=1 Tax=Aldrovandia affinis TaxID=143900 RepID=A0AAD7RQC6_9TELE|nr:hypothetical protein AAFF_G00135560 [Aldrovandia affinis]